MSAFIYSDDNKRYHTLSYYNRKRYGARVFKAAVSAGFTCPNIDGTCGRGGCVFCGGGSGYFTAPLLSVEEQLNEEIKRIRKKYPDSLICGYFQANSNTYGTPEELRELYFPLSEREDLVSLALSTRPDCLPDDVLDFLAELSAKKELTIELGLQTIHEKTARLMNRGHDYSTFLKACEGLKTRGIRTTIHIINGLPGETEEMMLATAAAVGKLKPGGIKIHLLHVIRNTALAQQGFEVKMSREEYISVTARQLALLPPETVIERLTGDADKRELISPLWSADKRFILGGIDKYMEEFNITQGENVAFMNDV